MSWLWPEAPPYAHLGEVETLDGFLLVLLAVDRAQRPLRRVARQPAARLRPRLLPAGPRGRAQGRHGRLPRHPPPRAARVRGPGGVDRGPHARRRQVGGPRPGSGHPGTWKRARAAGRGETHAARAVSHAQAARPGGARRARSSAPSRRRRRRCRGSWPRRCARWPADDRLRLRRPRPRGLPPLRAAGHRGARSSPTRSSTPSRTSARSAARNNLVLDAGRRATTTSRRSSSCTRAARSPTPRSCAKVRAALADADVAVVGAAGATGVRGAAWWEGDTVVGGAVRAPLHRARRRRGAAPTSGRSPRPARPRSTPSTAT